MQGKHSWTELNQKVAEARLGSAQSLDEVFEFLRSKLLPIARHRLPEAAEDVVHDSLIVIHSHFSEIESLEGLVAFSNRVLRNKIGNAYQNRERKSAQLGLEDISETDYSIKDDPEGAEMERVVRDAIERLAYKRPDCTRILLYLYDGFTASDIRDKVGLSRSNLKTRTFRCREALREVLSSQYSVEL
jgi:RNA polymerase sigma factor (sigma-70 family)